MPSLASEIQIGEQLVKFAGTLPAAEKAAAILSEHAAGLMKLA